MAFRVRIKVAQYRHICLVLRHGDTQKKLVTGVGDLRILSAALVAAATLFAAGVSLAAGSIEKSLMKLDPVERAHQACVVKGLGVVRKDKRLAKADRIMPDTFKRAQVEGNIVSAKGAAVHVGKTWYALSFECTVSDDQMKALDFSFQLGDAIPPESWEEVGLWH